MPFTIIIVLSIIILYYKNSINTGKKIQGRYIKVFRDTPDPISYADFIIYGNKKVMNPTSITIKPSLNHGNGINPQAISSDLSDIVLVETKKGNNPYILYDLGTTKEISQIIIINRKKFKEMMDDVFLVILDSHKTKVYEYRINKIQDIYVINVS